MFPLRLVPLLVALLALALPATAQAVTVSVSGTTLQITGEAGERNDLLVTYANGAYTVAERGAFVTVHRGNQCAASAGDTRCTGVSTLAIDAGDGADVVTLGTGVTAAATIIDGAGDDTVQGGGGADVFVTSPGDDTLLGGAGNDTFGDGGGEGADRLVGEAGWDTVTYATRTTPLTVSLDGARGDGAAGEDDEVATSNELIIGGSAGDVLRGGPGNEELRGSGGDDVLDGRGGADELQGDGGRDTADYSDRTANLTITANGSAGDAGENDNVLSDVESITGGSGDDDLSGSNGAGTLTGGAGDDTLRGNGGDDVLAGGGGDDALYGGDQNDTLQGGDGRDDLDGGNHDDVLDGGAAADTLYGNAGSDVADYSSRTGDLVVDLETDTDPDGDDLRSIEGAYGGSGDDRLLGDDGGGRFDGGPGDDLLDGRGGSDRMAGGAGWDRVDYSSRGDNVVVNLNDHADDGESGEKDDVRRDVEEVAGGRDDDRFTGDGDAETFIGGRGADQAWGNGGNDRLDGGDGNDQLWTGPGDDVAVGGPGNDRLGGETGNDALGGGDGDDTLDGHDGDDTLTGGGDDDRLSGHNGADRLDGGDEEDQLYGGAHDDTLTGGSGNDRTNGDDGNDTLDAGDGHDTLDGGRGADTVRAGTGNDKAYGSDDDDTVDGGPGDDTVEGGRGDDVLTGGDGNDRVAGGDGNDTVDAGEGNDRPAGDNGDDRVIGAGGDDQLDGGAGNDVLDAGAGADRASGADGDDTVDGGHGNDRLNGGNGADLVRGGTEDDGVYGDGGPDRLEGGDGDDELKGAGDADVLVGGLGADRMAGEDGEDTVDYGDRTVGVRITNDGKPDDGQPGEGDDVDRSVDHFIGGAGNDVIITRVDWPHRIYGEGGADVLDGGPKPDLLVGGEGNDRLTGRGGKDTYDGGNGADRLSGSDGIAEVLRCGAGKDRATRDGADKAVSCETVRRGKSTAQAAPEPQDVQPVGAPKAGTTRGTRRVYSKGAFVGIPGSPGERIDRRLLRDIRYLKAKYKIAITDGFAMSGHARGGEHPRGLALDIVPGAGGSWADIDRLARWAEPRQNRPRAPFRWVGYNGDSGHGRGHHLHLSWRHSGARPGRTAKWVEVLSFKKQRATVRVRNLIPLSGRTNPRMGGAPSVKTGLRSLPRCRGASQLHGTWKAAARAFKVRWSILAAITEIESGFGCNMGPSSAGALGWTQFMPATWKHFGMDADGDGKASPYNSADAVFSTARYLRAHGAPRNYRKAIFAYNHATWYVNDVLKRARKYR